MKSPSPQQPLPIAEKLESLASRIRKEHPPLGGPTVAAAIRKLSTAIDRFEAFLNTVTENRPAALAELEQFLSSPNVRAGLKVPDLQAVAKEAVGLRLKSERLSKAREELLHAAKTATLAKKILFHARQRLALKARPPQTTDLRGLRAELLRIGGLDETSAEHVFRTAYRNITSVRALARANAIRGAERLDRETLWKEILVQARRLRANIRHLQN